MTIGTGFMIVATTMPMNMLLEKMSLGMIETVKIFVLTLLFSLPFGLVVAWGRMLFIKNTDFKRLQILCGNNFICA